jgi:hypothetical protein
MMSRTWKDIREDCRERAWRLGEERTRAREARRLGLDEAQWAWEDGAWDAANLDVPPGMLQRSPTFPPVAA